MAPDALLSDSDYDTVVIGTGLTESVLAASISLAGKRVLHLDPNPFYGAQSATLKLAVIQNLINESCETVTETFSQRSVLEGLSVDGGYEVEPLNNVSFNAITFPNGVRVLEPFDESVSSTVLTEEVRNKLLIDLMPRAILASGAMVNLLVQCSVGNYVDFRAFDSTYVQFAGDGLRHVPASRSDIFQDRFISMIEKRLLMRFMKSALKNSESEPLPSADGALSSPGVEPSNAGAHAERTFLDEMKKAQLTDKLQTFLTHAVALLDEEVMAPVGLKALNLYQKSLIRYNTKTAFLYPNFGSGELAEGFCRLCAVHGGTYALRRSVAGILVKQSQSTNTKGAETVNITKQVVGVVTTEKEVIRCKNVFVSELAETRNIVNENGAVSQRAQVWRAVCVIDGSIVRGSDNLAMVVVPRMVLGNSNATVRIRQVSSSVAVCPKGFYLVYFETVGKRGTESDILACVEHYIQLNSRNEDDTASVSSQSGSSTSEASETLEKAKTVDHEGPPSQEAVIKPKLLWGMTYSRGFGEPKASVSTEGLHFVSDGGAEPDAEFVISEAKRCFQTVSPGSSFCEVPSKDF